MKNLWTSIFVKNMDESVKFYHEILGLEMDRRYSPGPGMEIAFLGKGETKFELMCQEGFEVSHTASVSTGFQVASLEESYQQMKTLGVKIATEPFSPSPYISFFFIEDPDGYRIQLVELK
ncbi:VOC family protein [Acidaminobacter sp. JC074]|uniref:VOC family protein n=1 Tax=Acidaminobacter sp. JC074 TaxID=2530199 RepID=UPI001F10F061|nr:VOC family protein [Acidaminobacter sp. JC074]MCH4889613.1 VOC family protein [Acidaminobacter sp. JC074]